MRVAVAGLAIVLLVAGSPPTAVDADGSPLLGVSLAQIALCESDGDPRAVNESASETHWDGRVGSYGLYQFGRGTWGDVAGRAWRAGLVEVDWSHGYPHHAPPRAQTLIAEILWDDGRGWGHWRGCSLRLAEQAGSTPTAD